MKLIAVRLPDEVAAAVEREAAKQERSKSAVVVRALRAALDINQNENWKGLAAAKISEEPVRKRKACQHGNDPLSCERPACRQARG